MTINVRPLSGSRPVIIIVFRNRSRRIAAIGIMGNYSCRTRYPLVFKQVFGCAVIV
jgi:hypothetical protein